MAVDDPDLMYRHRLPTGVIGMPEETEGEGSDSIEDATG